MSGEQPIAQLRLHGDGFCLFECLDLLAETCDVGIDKTEIREIEAAHAETRRRLEAAGARALLTQHRRIVA